MKLFNIAFVTALVLAPAVASAQNPKRDTADDDTGKKSYATGDGNRMICRTSQIAGSRLRSGRVCMTAAEWAESKRVTRQMIEQAQTQRPTAGQ